MRTYNPNPRAVLLERYDLLTERLPQHQELHSLQQDAIRLQETATIISACHLRSDGWPTITGEEFLIKAQHTIKNALEAYHDQVLHDHHSGANGLMETRTT